MQSDAVRYSQMQSDAAIAVASVLPKLHLKVSTACNGLHAQKCHSGFWSVQTMNLLPEGMTNQISLSRLSPPISSSKPTPSYWLNIGVHLVSWRRGLTALVCRRSKMDHFEYSSTVQPLTSRSTSPMGESPSPSLHRLHTQCRKEPFEASTLRW